LSASRRFLKLGEVYHQQIHFVYDRHSVLIEGLIAKHVAEATSICSKLNYQPFVDKKEPIMSTWIKEGVFGELNRAAALGLRNVRKLYDLKNKDLFITSIREGTHSAGSLHSIGDAWDQRANGVTVDEIKKALGPSFDVVDESDHIHCEYDPK
jgi:hypothetical protein